VKRLLVLALLFTAACGEDDPPPPQGPKAPGAPQPPKPGAPGAGSGSGAKLVPQIKAEDDVRCPTPTSAKACDPAVPTACEMNEYCLPTASGNFCGGCPERTSIRHEFKERDFAADQNRDPFQSSLLSPLTAGAGSAALPRNPTELCQQRKDQLQAQNYSYADLKLRGIVARGTQRKVIMEDPGKLGHLLQRGDCVGKEKAIVKDIGTGYVTLTIGGDKPVEVSIELHPKAPQVNALPSDQPDPTKPQAPIVEPAPPPQPARPTQPAQPAGAGTTVIERQPAKTVPIVPPQAPTTLKP